MHKGGNMQKVLHAIGLTLLSSFLFTPLSLASAEAAGKAEMRGHHYTLIKKHKHHFSRPAPSPHANRLCVARRRENRLCR